MLPPRRAPSCTAYGASFGCQRAAWQGQGSFGRHQTPFGAATLGLRGRWCRRCTGSASRDGRHTVDLRLITGVPCLLVSPLLAKRVLKLLKITGWAKGTAKLILDRRLEKVASSARAYQLTDAAAAILEAEELPAESLEPPGPKDIAALEIQRLLSEGAIEWKPFFQLHEYVIDETRCDKGKEEVDRTSFALHFMPTPAPAKCSVPKCLEAAREPTLEPKFTFAELFAGIGGFRLALEGLGGACVFASEINPWARRIYERNFGGVIEPSRPEKGLLSIAGDIKRVRSTDILQHDLLTAGFPCQPFTAGGGRSERGPLGFRDPRGQLFWQIVRLLRAHRDTPELQPKAILLENVPGIAKNDISRIAGSCNGDPLQFAERMPTDDLPVSMASGLPVVLGALSESGYVVSWKLYDARQLVPQMRERIYIVALREDLVGKGASEFAWPQLPDMQPTLKDIMHGSCDALSDVNLELYRVPPEQWAAITESRYYKRFPEHRLPPLSGVANTVRGSYRSGAKLFSQFVPMPSNPDLTADPSAVPWRFFTPRECARLQGFPEWFDLACEGNEEGQEAVPEPSQYQAIGNAVPVPVVATLADALLKALPCAAKGAC